MLKRLILAVLMWACVSGVAEARERLFGYCMKGGYQVTTQGLKSTEFFQRTFRSCTVRVYDAGTTALVASIYSDNLTPASTPLSNPFTSASDGYWEFYAPAGRYDVQFTDTATSTQYTWGDLLACDPLGPNADTVCTYAPPSAFTHQLLSDTHTDTVPYSPPEIGDFARGNLYQMWQRIGVAQVGQILALIDVGGGQPYPEWVWPSTLDTCTSIQVNGVESGCEHEINFIPGTNISSITATDDSSNDRTDVTINALASGGANPALHRWSLVIASGVSTGATVTYLGDVPYGTVGTSFNATATSPPYVLSTATGPGNPQAVLFGRHLFYPGKSTYVNFKLRLQSLIVERSFIMLNDTPVTAYVNDTDILPHVGFRYSTNAGDTNFQCLSADGATQEISDSGVPADLSWHLFEFYDKGTYWDYYIDQVKVCSHSTFIPSGVTLKPYLSTQSLDFDDKGWDVAWWYGEIDY